MNDEYCYNCDAATGRAGISDDSLEVEIDGKIWGPLCQDCYAEIIESEPPGLFVEEPT